MPFFKTLISYRIHRAVLLTLFGGIAISLTLFYLIIGNNMRELRREFRTMVIQHSLLLTKEIEMLRQFLVDTQFFFSASQKVTKEEFNYFANIYGSNLVLAVWVSINKAQPGAVVPVYTQSRIDDYTADTLIRLPIIQDLLRDTIGDLAFKTSDAFPFALNGTSEPLVAIAAPTYYYLYTGTESRKKALTGLLLAVMRISPLVTKLKEPGGRIREKIEVYLTEKDHLDRKHLIFTQIEEPEGRIGLATKITSLQCPVESVTIPLGSRAFEFVFTPPPQFMARAANWTAWTILLLGMILTAACAVFLQSFINRNRRIGQLVEEKTRELQQSNQALDDFVYIVSHDLKEPLRGIRNFSAFLLEDCGENLNKECRDYIDGIIRMAERLQVQIDDLLKFSRASHKDFKLANVDLVSVIDEVRDSLQALIEESGAHIVIEKPLPVIRYDRSCMVEIMTNLIQNALKYRREGVPPVVTVGSTERTGRADVKGPVFYVEDNGIGIKKEHLDTIFKMFKRLHSQEQYGGGTGVGLAIVKKMVERHGGVIWAESEYGKGSVFFFTIQRAGERR